MLVNLTQGPTLWVVENIWPQDDIQLGEENQIWWHFSPGQTQHLYTMETVCFTAPPPVLQTQRSLSIVWQNHCRSTLCSHHTWKTHTCTQLWTEGSFSRCPLRLEKVKSHVVLLLSYLQNSLPSQLLSLRPQILSQHHCTRPHVHAILWIKNLKWDKNININCCSRGVCYVWNLTQTSGMVTESNSFLLL